MWHLLPIFIDKWITYFTVASQRLARTTVCVYPRAMTLALGISHCHVCALITVTNTDGWTARQLHRPYDAVDESLSRRSSTNCILEVTVSIDWLTGMPHVGYGTPDAVDICDEWLTCLPLQRVCILSRGYLVRYNLPGPVYGARERKTIG